MRPNYFFDNNLPLTDDSLLVTEHISLKLNFYKCFPLIYIISVKNQIIVLYLCLLCTVLHSIYACFVLYCPITVLFGYCSALCLCSVLVMYCTTLYLCSVLVMYCTTLYLCLLCTA